jgi:acyl-coenzyme A synthetase/AMP-(fatty) acid ligase
VEVEEVLLQHPAVAEAGVVGIPDAIYGEEIKAFVVIKPDKRVTEEELIAFCKDRLPTFKLPKKVQFTESLPKNILGKVLRAELRTLG